MSLGVAFVLTQAQVEKLLALEDDEAREAWFDDLEEGLEDADWFEYDKAWDELHRCLGDGELVIQDGPPLAHAVFGSQPLMEDEDSAIFAGYLPAADVQDVAQSLRQVDRSWLRERFDALDLDGELFEYVWECLEELRKFYARLGDRRAAMLFTVDG